MAEQIPGRVLIFHVQEQEVTNDQLRALHVAATKAGLHMTFLHARRCFIDEHLQVTPKKFHLDNGAGKQVCSTDQVSKRRIIKDLAKVTCKLCLQWASQRVDKGNHDAP